MTRSSIFSRSSPVNVFPRELLLCNMFSQAAFSPVLFSRAFHELQFSRAFYRLHVLPRAFQWLHASLHFLLVPCFSASRSRRLRFPALFTCTVHTFFQHLANSSGNMYRVSIDDQSSINQFTTRFETARAQRSTLDYFQSNIHEETATPRPYLVTAKPRHLPQSFLFCFVLFCFCLF